MGSKNDITPFSGRESEGLGWADQWDYKYDPAGDEASKAPATKKEKMAELSKKAKAAASTGYAKAKVGASFAATKVSAGVGWAKQQVEKRKKSTK